MTKLCVALAGAAIFACAAADAQTAPTVTPVPALSPIAAPATNMAMLRIGTEVPLKTTEFLTTKEKKLKTGQRVRLEVAENVLVNDVVVIPAGSPAIGEITDVRNKGMWGKSGKFTGRVLYATVNGRQIRLTGVFDDKGTAGGIGAAAVSAVVFLPAGFFMTGTSAQMAIGTPVKGFMDEDLPLTIAAVAPAPMVVGAPSASPAVAKTPAPTPTVTTTLALTPATPAGAPTLTPIAEVKAK